MMPACWFILFHGNVERGGVCVLYHCQVGTSEGRVAALIENVTIVNFVAGAELWLVADEDILPHVNLNRV